MSSEQFEYFMEYVKAIEVWLGVAVCTIVVGMISLLVIAFIFLG